MIEFVYPHTHLVAGVDEVDEALGRGCGDSCRYSDPARPIVGLNDSKNSLKSVVWRFTMKSKKSVKLEPWTGRTA